MGKKRKNADFQKVKLKVGRHLPKGMNVTDTKFKAKKIIIRNQLKSQSNEFTTHRKLTLQELLSRLCHSNPSTRRESLLGIKELILNHKELISAHLSILVNQISEIILDQELSVRQTALNVMNIILTSVSSSQIEPFFLILNSYLCCAMTHINIDICRDSLKLLDIMLNTFPELICSSGRVLDNFLEQISSLNEKSASGTRKEERYTRVLSVRPSERITSQEWRIQVLKRLRTFLKANKANLLMKHNKIQNKNIPEISWNGYAPLHISLYEHGGLKPVIAMSFSLHSMKSSTLDTETSMKDPNKIKTFISVLMPLLSDTWAEAAPTTFISPLSGDVLYPEAADTMNCVLKIILLLGEWAELMGKENNNRELIQWFRKNYSLSVLTRFMAWFPYSRHQLLHKKGKREYCKNEVSCMTVNLTICDLFTLLAPEDTYANAAQRKKIMDYLLQIIKSDHCDVTVVPLVTKIMKMLLLDSQKIDDCEKHLYGLLQLYHKWKTGEKDRECMLTFFSDLVLDFKYRHLLQTPVIKLWLKAFPLELNNMIKEEVSDMFLLSMMNKIAARAYPAFLDGLQECSSEIVELLQVEDENLQLTTLQLICKFRHISIDLFHRLAGAIRNPSLSVKNISSLLQLLNHRMLQINDPGFTAGNYTSFLFSIIADHFHSYSIFVLLDCVFKDEEEQWLNLSRDMLFPVHDQIPFNLSTYTIVSSMMWGRHCKIAEFAIKALLQFPDFQNVSHCVHNFLLQFFSCCTCIPVHCAAALLSLKAKLAPGQNFQDNDDCWMCIAELTLALFLYEVGLVTSLDASSEEYKAQSVLGALNISVQSIGNTGAICEVIGQKITEIRTIEQSQYVGAILQQLLKSGVMEAEDLMILITVMEDMKIHLGEELEEEQWWMNINCELSLRQQQHLQATGS